MYTVPRKEVLLVLPYLGKLSLELRTRLNKIFRSKIPTCKLVVIFRSSVRIKNFFGFKDKIPGELKSGLVYRFKCGGCNTTYYGKTTCHFHVRICEHFGISPLTGKVLTTLNRTAISDHLADTPTCYATTDNFDILSRDVVDYKLLIKESLFIKRDDPPLSRTINPILHWPCWLMLNNFFFVNAINMKLCHCNYICIRHISAKFQLNIIYHYEIICYF